MGFTIRLWRLVLTVRFLDVDTSDQDIEVAVKLSWKKSVV
uniref:Uncharacterized protein n=1 Tax=viral metagenome TaxID=1070528 RepID=A0A6M3IZB4_9ZZZZ